MVDYNKIIENNKIRKALIEKNKEIFLELLRERNRSFGFERLWLKKRISF